MYIVLPVLIGTGPELSVGTASMGGMTIEQSGRLTRKEISAAIDGLGWRLVLGAALGRVPADSLAHAAQVATRAVAACGPDADAGLQLDLRPDAVLITLRDRATAWVTPREIGFAERISAALGTVEPGGPERPVQALEIAIDALEITLVRPFWQAVLAYADEPGDDPERALVDPFGQGPVFWFQRMDAPRPQRNRVHIDVSVPHDDAARRIEAAVAAGGTVVHSGEAPAFWVLADPEGNEACVTTWQARD